MPTVKISELPEIYHLSTNTEATLVVGVDLSTGTTGKINVATLGEGLYAYQPLKVGQNQVLFSNTIGQFSGNSVTFLQINNQNFNANGSADYVASASDSDNTNKFIDMGINGKDFSDPIYSSMKPYDGYLFNYGPSALSASGNLVIGTASAHANIVYIVGGTVTNNIVARMTKTDLQLSAGYNIKFGDGSIQSVAASPVNYSQAAFTLANNISVLAQAAFNVANTSSANTFITQGIDVTQNTRLTVIEGTDIAQNARTLIIEGVDNTQNNRISAIEGANFSQNTRMTIIEGTDTTQNTRLTVIEGTDATQNTRLTDIENVNLSQNTAISATDGKMQNSYNTANNAFVKANNALANTTGSFNGTLNILNNLTVNGTVVLANTNFVTTEAAFRITGTGSSQTPTQSGTLMQLTSKQNTPARVLIDSIGTSNTSYSIIAGRTARGTVDAPTATQNNDILLRIAGNSYGDTGYAPFGDARIDFVATENHSDTVRGSRIRFWNTPIGTNTVNEIASFNGDSVTFTGTVAPVKGFIYTPNIYPSAQTAVTISFANDSVVRAQTSAGLAVTLSNFVVGKSVEAWITNTAGGGQTFTHGCSATNSTVNSTTYNIPATSTIFVKYWCMDGTLANTFVAITHA